LRDTGGLINYCFIPYDPIIKPELRFTGRLFSLLLAGIRLVRLVMLSLNVISVVGERYPLYKINMTPFHNSDTITCARDYQIQNKKGRFGNGQANTSGRFA
jgi:hypothetical protein